MEQSNLSAIFKALGNPQRLALFEMVYRMARGGEGEGCCGGVERAFSRACDCMELSRSTISHHFKELRNAGLITCTREGQAMRCQVNEQALEAVRAFLK